MKIRMATGLWRLWLVSSVSWVTCFAIFFASEYVGLGLEARQKVLASEARSHEHELSFDPLVPRYKPCWDGKNYDIAKLSDGALIQVYECQLQSDQFDLVKRALVTIAGVPSVVFLLGWSLLWIGRGFRPQTQ